MSEIDLFDVFSYQSQPELFLGKDLENLVKLFCQSNLNENQVRLHVKILAEMERQYHDPDLLKKWNKDPEKLAMLRVLIDLGSNFSPKTEVKDFPLLFDVTEKYQKLGIKSEFWYNYLSNYTAKKEIRRDIMLSLGGLRLCKMVDFFEETGDYVALISIKDLCQQFSISYCDHNDKASVYSSIKEGINLYFQDSYLVDEVVW